MVHSAAIPCSYYKWTERLARRAVEARLALDVDAANRLANLHRLLGLPLDPHSTNRVPYEADSAECVRWADAIDATPVARLRALKLVVVADAWSEFLRRCGGYTAV